MVMCDTEFKTKGNIIQAKDKIEPQHIYILKKHTKQISKQNKKKERKGAKKDLNPASSASCDFSLPINY